jgi:hypothetical protein
MKATIFLLVVLAATACVVLAAPLTVRRQHSAQHCVAGRPHAIHADLMTVDDHSIIMLDSVQGLAEVECDIDSTRLLLEFQTPTAMNTFASALKMYDTFVTASDKFNCVRMQNDSTTTSFIMRRVLGMSPVEDAPAYMELLTAPARYDEIIQVRGRLMFVKLGSDVKPGSS